MRTHSLNQNGLFSDENSNRAKLNALCYAADYLGVRKLLQENAMDLKEQGGAVLLFAIRSIEKKNPAPSAEECRATIDELVKNKADIHFNEDAPMMFALLKDNHAAVECLLSYGNQFQIDAEIIEDYITRNDLLLSDELKKMLREATAIGTGLEKQPLGSI